MPLQSNTLEFGAAANCSSLADIESFIRSNAAAPKARIQAAAFGLALVASQAIGATTYFEDARHVLDQMVRAKANIDIAAWHSMEVVSTTASVLLIAQRYLDEQTIACTEWPTPHEVADVALEAARKHVAAA